GRRRAGRQHLPLRRVQHRAGQGLHGRARHRGAAVSEAWLDALRWNEDGLIPVIARDARSGEVLMLAWMNREALAATRAGGEAVYWSRSRRRLWKKGESSGHVQKVTGIYTDCDQDALMIEVEQIGGIACHTG